MQPSTRERLLREAVRLFASRGFAGTTVGDIEAAAGLQPRRGALYRHFPSKVALLEAAVGRVTASVDQGEGEFTNIPLDDPRGTAVLVGRFILANLDMQRDLTHIFERDGERLETVRDQFLASSDAGFRASSGALRQWAHAANLEIDTDAFAVVLIGSLINFRRSTWTLGQPPLGLDEDRFLEGFASIFSIIVDQNRT